MENEGQISGAAGASSLPVCSCGHDRNHHDTETKGDYGFWGWMAMLTGATVKPNKVHFICRRCRQEFDETTDPDDLLKHI